jgi:hypothetical protein
MSIKSRRIGGYICYSRQNIGILIGILIIKVLILSYGCRSILKAS